MKLLHKTKWVIALMLVAMSLFFAGTALASYVGTGYFATNQMYRCHFGYYSTENQNAAAKWSATTDLDIYASCGSYNVATQAYNFGWTNWQGNTIICDMYNNCTPDHPEVLSGTYHHCTARSNTYWLDSWTSTERQFNATHELGHCWSLGHDTQTGSVMQQGQLSIVDPNFTNIYEVNARH